MSVLFATSYMGAAYLLSGGVTVETSSSYREATYTDDAMTLTESIILQTPLFAAELTEGWIHACVIQVNSSTVHDGNMMGAYNSVRGGFDACLLITNSNTVLQYWNGSALTSVGASTAITGGTLGNYDFYFKKHASTGIVRIYKNGTLLLEATGLDTSNFDCDCVRFTGFASGGGTTIMSQLLVADESTIGWKVFAADLTAGALNDFTAGTVTDISVNSIQAYSSFMASATADQVATFTVENLPAGSLIPKAVVINMRAKKGTTGPANVQAVARVGGVNYYTADKALSVGIEPVSHIFDTNPATGLAWDTSTVNAMETGARSRT